MCTAASHDHELVVPPHGKQALRDIVQLTRDTVRADTVAVPVGQERDELIFAHRKVPLHERVPGLQARRRGSELPRNHSDDLGLDAERMRGEHVRRDLFDSRVGVVHHDRFVGPLKGFEEETKAVSVSVLEFGGVEDVASVVVDEEVVSAAHDSTEGASVRALARTAQSREDDNFSVHEDHSILSRPRAFTQLPVETSKTYFIPKSRPRRLMACS